MYFGHSLYVRMNLIFFITIVNPQYLPTFQLKRVVSKADHIFVPPLYPDFTVQIVSIVSGRQNLSVHQHRNSPRIMFLLLMRSYKNS